VAKSNAVRTTRKVSVRGSEARQAARMWPSATEAVNEFGWRD